MVAMGVRRLTVTQGHQPVGIISDTDIFRAGQGGFDLAEHREPADSGVEHENRWRRRVAHARDSN